ncbi:MAG: hypothetical protein HDT39_04120 [Lachnospiraceae bacterium]|nr:hypothetical protein [Lachnospiraceae bacterium]
MESAMNSTVFLLTNVFDLYIIHKFMKIFFQNMNVNKEIEILCYFIIVYLYDSLSKIFE